MTKDKARSSASRCSLEGQSMDTSLSAEAVKPDIFNPEDFLTANEKISILSLGLLGKLYNLTKTHENNGSLEDPLGLQTKELKPSKSKKKRKHNVMSKAEAPVSKLITENFDEDQIWEEIELQNRFIYDNLVTSVSKVLAFKDKSLELEESDVEEVPDDDDDVAAKDNSMLGKGELENLEENEDEQVDSDFFESDEKHRKSVREDSKKYPKSIVDDKFFSLAQMTEHIERIEAEEQQADLKKSKDDDEDSSGEESIDLFDEIPSEQEEDEEAPKYFYQDFFDPPLDGDKPQEDSENESGDSDDEKEEESSSKKKSVSFDLDRNDANPEAEAEDSDDGSEELSDDEGEEEAGQIDALDLKNQINKTLSTFEKKKRKIEESIKEIEDEALQPKAWHLMGEATAESRPENALLEEHLLYDHLIRPAPQITVETTMKLEDVIKQRIKDAAWDDVQRKVKPVDDPREYKKRLVMDAEKSKASLAEIYEQEYLEKKKAEDGVTEEKEPEEHTQIKNELKSLFQQLDALTHFHFTPKPPPAEVKIISNAPSVSIEETTGVSVSDANMLAPQEIQDHAKGAIKGHGERTSTDKKRERRKKKKKQHLKRLMQEEKARAKGLGLRNIKLAEGIVKSQQKAGKVTEGYSTSNQSAKELKSSRAFFAKLQQGAAAHIDKVANRKRISETESNKTQSAKKYKL